LTVDQYKALLQAIPYINASLKSSGIVFEETGAVDQLKAEEDEDEKPKKHAVKKSSKANIEETSDEEE
jgi:hypothetical protein